MFSSSSDEDFDKDSDTESEEEESTGKKVSSKKQTTKTVSKNDKGRFVKTPLKQVNVGLPVSELKRKKEDEALEKGEKKRPRKDRSPSNAMRGTAFSGREIKVILSSIFEQKDDKDATEDFFKKFPETLRTKNSVRAKVTKVRTDLTASLTKVHEEDVETNGVFVCFVVCVYFYFYLFCVVSHDEGLSAHKFLAPIQFTNVEKEEFLLVHSKKQWKEIQCSTQVSFFVFSSHVFFTLFCFSFLIDQIVNGKIRFALSKMSVIVPEGFEEESTKVVFVQHEVLDDWEKPTKFEDDAFKGLKFSRKPASGKSGKVESDMF